jgi:hypothetical protein
MKRNRLKNKKLIFIKFDIWYGNLIDNFKMN